MFYTPGYLEWRRTFLEESQTVSGVLPELSISEILAAYESGLVGRAYEKLVPENSDNDFLFAINAIQGELNRRGYTP